MPPDDDNRFAPGFGQGNENGAVGFPLGPLTRPFSPVPVPCPWGLPACSSGYPAPAPTSWRRWAGGPWGRPTS